MRAYTVLATALGFAPLKKGIGAPLRGGIAGR